MLHSCFSLNYRIFHQKEMNYIFFLILTLYILFSYDIIRELFDIIFFKEEIYMRNIFKLKREARSQLKNGWGLAIGCFFIALILFPFISSIINSLAKNSDSIFLRIFIYVVTFVLNFLLVVGTLKFSLNYAQSDKTPFVGDIFSGFSVFRKALLIYIILIFSIGLGLALFIVPGIIFSLMLSQALYILVDDNKKSALDCIKESIQMMKGNKLELFILSLSFLGWFILMILPIFILKFFPLPTYFILVYLLFFLIGLLILIPYINVTFALFYLKVKNAYYGITEQE